MLRAPNLDVNRPSPKVYASDELSSSFICDVLICLLHRLLDHGSVSRRNLSSLESKRNAKKAIFDGSSVH